MIPSVIAAITLGLSVALPFGPISLICVQRSIADGFGHGLATGAGAASAQGLFATAALLGRDTVSSELIRWSGPIRWLAAATLLYLGIRTLARRNKSRVNAARAGIPAAYGSSLVFALSNPMTLLPYLALASGTVVEDAAGQLFSPWSVPGVMVGAVAWYAVLSIVASMFRPGVMQGLVGPLNLLAGSILVVFGIRVGLG